VHVAGGCARRRMSCGASRTSRGETRARRVLRRQRSRHYKTISLVRVLVGSCARRRMSCGVSRQRPRHYKTISLVRVLVGSCARRRMSCGVSHTSIGETRARRVLSRHRPRRMQDRLGTYEAISLGAYDAVGLSAYKTVGFGAYEAISVYAAAKANLAKGGGAGRKEEGIDQRGGWVEKKRDRRSRSSTSSHMNAREACRIGMRERRIPRVSRLKLKPSVLESVRGAPTSPAGRVVWAKDDSATERFDF